MQAAPQKVEGTDDPRYLAEIWWQLGNFHFDQIDPHGGPYNLNRAVASYEHSMEFKKPPIFGVAMYKQAWTYYKQQRYKNGRRLVREAAPLRGRTRGEDR